MRRATLHIAALTLIVALGVAFAAPGAFAQSPRILLLTKSEGFEHGPVVEKGGANLVAKTLEELCAENGATLTATKNGSAVSADNLKNFDLVVFYTQGDLTKPSKDGGDCMTPEGAAALLDWIKAGGAFVAYHSGSDTFHGPEGGPASPYIAMVGGEFISHGQQFEGTLKVVDPQHPTMAAFPAEWNVNEEWYLFKNLNKETMHILAVLDPGEKGRKQEQYRINAYPMIWCSAYGQGKVYFNGMGHREELWDNPMFREGIVDAAEWALDDASSPADTEPNWAKVMPQFEKK